jgi:uncharacterized protein YjbI with pentapeptide repeats
VHYYEQTNWYNLANSKLNGTKLIGANLSGADLRGADLSGAILKVPIPPNANIGFSFATLSGADLLDTIIQAGLVSLYYDDNMRKLTEAQIKPILQDTVLQGVLYNTSTIWPIGFEIPPSAIFQK